MYSIDDHTSLVELTEWKATAALYSDQDIIWAVIGNKTDLPREVPEDTVQGKCNDLKTDINLTISAKSGDNVKEAFEKIIARVHNRSRSTCPKPAKQTNVMKVVSTKPKRGLC